MVRVTRLDGSQLYVNAELIEVIETTPDTVLSLTGHRKIVVAEPADTIVERVIAYKRRIVHDGPLSALSQAPALGGAPDGA